MRRPYMVETIFSLQGPRDLYIVARERKRGTVLLAVCRSTQCNYLHNLRRQGAPISGRPSGHCDGSGHQP